MPSSSMKDFVKKKMVWLPTQQINSSPCVILTVNLSSPFDYRKNQSSDMYISSWTSFFCSGKMCKIASFQQVLKVKVPVTYMHTQLELEEALTYLLGSFWKGHFSPKGSQVNPINGIVSYCWHYLSQKATFRFSLLNADFSFISSRNV